MENGLKRLWHMTKLSTQTRLQLSRQSKFRHKIADRLLLPFVTCVYVAVATFILFQSGAQ